MDNTTIEKAKTHFSQIVEEQLKRVEKLKEPQDWTDFFSIKTDNYWNYWR